MIPRILAAAVAALFTVLGPQLFLTLAFVTAALTVAVLGFGIATVLAETGFSVRPAGRVPR
jgi:hypothetical protein